MTMTRRPTMSELIWPDDDELPKRWAEGVTERILDWTWRAFDEFSQKHLATVDLTQPLEQLERDLVRQHFIEIQILFSVETDGYSSLIPHHEWPEMESRSSAPAKPPAYDLAYVCERNRRWAWPIEAKVLPSPGALAEYLKDVNEKFVKGIASPLAGEGGMVGYLLSEDTTTCLTNLEKKLGKQLNIVDAFKERCHRTSKHTRKDAPNLRLHHMIMVCLERSLETV